MKTLKFNWRSLQWKQFQLATFYWKCKNSSLHTANVKHQCSDINAVNATVRPDIRFRQYSKYRGQHKIKVIWLKLATHVRYTWSQSIPRFPSPKRLCSFLNRFDIHHYFRAPRTILTKVLQFEFMHFTTFVSTNFCTLSPSIQLSVNSNRSLIMRMRETEKVRCQISGKTKMARLCFASDSFYVYFFIFLALSSANSLPGNFLIITIILISYFRK